ncbi:MAG: HEAT repeat domain-containing protein [Candidatus Latescibacteria bacterium]|nr:HEAT repeat domain-containing protein [Candidatus Latescibacterota bacterium]
MRKNYLVVCCLLFVVSISYAFEPSLSKTNREQINNALAIQGITENELGFEKKWALDSVFRLKIVTDLMDDPLKTPDYLDHSVNYIDKHQSSISKQLLFLSQQLDINITDKDINKLNTELNHELKRYDNKNALIFEQVENIFRASFTIGDKYLKQATKNLNQDQINQLLMLAPVLWGDQDDSTINILKGALHREFNVPVDTSIKIEIDSLLEMVQKLDRHALSLSGCAIALAVDRSLHLLADNKSEIDAYQQTMIKSTVPEVKGFVYACDDTDWGKIVIGGEGDNIYEDNFALIIDLGGNDIYKGRTASGIGFLSAPFSICIDLAGDDLYDARDKSFNFGAGLFGAGFLIDLEGNDTYQASHNCLGTGYLGTGVLIDKDGDDYYTAGYFSQGAGIFGVGALMDINGDDTYRGAEYCQAFSSTWGYGLLADFGGNDLYYAGGKYLHKPLLPDDYRSLSQGFSIGFRPVASGGISLLYDRSGQDYYNGGVFAQGTSYWYALGMLYDGEGNDFYNATQYAQGAGIHLAIGILIDRAGDDHYFSRFGPAQGEGHDFSVGILIDKKGDDSYLTSGGQGIGLTNSFGLLIDNAGDDVYTTKQKNFGQGMANFSRGFGGIGIFLDLQGDDIYPRASIADNSSQWTQSVYGFGIDQLGTPRDIEAEIQEEPDTIKLKTATIEDIFKEATLWEVGSAKKRVKAGRAELLKRGQEAVDYIFDKKIFTKDGLELRAIEDLAKSLTDSTYTDSLNKIKIKQMLYQSLYHKDRWARANSAYLLGKIKVVAAIDSLILAFKENRIRARAMIGAFEDIEDSSVVPIIIPYLKDKDEPTRIASARALAKLKDPRAIPALYDALNDKFFTVRIAAETALVAIGDTTRKFLLTKTKDSNIIRVLAVLGARLDTLEKRTERDEIINIIIPYLSHKKPALRLKAVTALGQFEEAKPILQEKMVSETNEFVLTKYKEILKQF